MDLTGAFDRTQSGIAGGIERGGVGGEASTGALCSPRDFDVFCGVAAAAPHSISQTTARRSCHVGVLESAAVEEDGCRKSRSQRGSNSITRPIQTPCKNLDWQLSSKTKSVRMGEVTMLRKT